MGGLSLCYAGGRSFRRLVAAQAALCLLASASGCTDEHRPDELPAGSLRGMRINLVVYGPDSDEDKRRRCIQELEAHGGRSDPTAPLTVSLFLDSTNRLGIRTNRWGLLNQARPSWGMNELCEDAFAAAVRMTKRPDVQLLLREPAAPRPMGASLVGQPRTASPATELAMGGATNADEGIDPATRKTGRVQATGAVPVPTTDQSAPLEAYPEQDARALAQAVAAKAAREQAAAAAATAHALDENARARFARLEYRGAAEDWCAAYGAYPLAEYLYYAADAFHRDGLMHHNRTSLEKARFFYARFQDEGGSASVRAELDRVEEDLRAMQVAD